MRKSINTLIIITVILVIFGCDKKRDYKVEANLVGAAFNLKEEYHNKYNKIMPGLWDLKLYESLGINYKIKNNTGDTLFIPIKSWSNNYKSRIDVSINNSPYKGAFVWLFIGKDTIPPSDSLRFSIRILDLKPFFSSKSDSSLNVRKALAKIRTKYIPDSIEVKNSKYSVPRIVFNRNVSKTSLGSYGKRVIILDIINNKEKYSVFP